MSKAIEMAFAKFAVAFVAVAMLVALVAPAAQAQTTEELQAMINDLLAQVASLQGQLGGGGSSVASGVCPYTWTRSLNMGASGMDVMKLQQFLNADPETRIAASGVGSAGMETEYYGAMTGAAVAKFQTKYRSEILTPLGLVNATTYFGPATMAQANALCVSAPVVDDSSDDADMGDDDDMSDDDDDSSSNTGSMSRTEASLEDFNMKDGDDTVLNEGQNDAPVAVAEFDVEDGDVTIQRVDVAFDANSANTEQDPWDTFESVSLWMDGDMIAEIDADDEDEWEENTPNTGDYRLRFTGLSERVDEGDSAEITIGVSVQNSVDGTNVDAEVWDIFIPTNGVRGRDGAGVDQYTGDTADTVTVDIEEEGADDELIFKSSTNDPDSTTLQVEDDRKSDWITIFTFDLDTDDSTSDIEVEDMIVEVMTKEADGTTPTSTALLINDVRLMVNGDELGDVTVTHDQGVGTASTSIDFDNNEFVIDAGDRQEVEVQVEFKQLAAGLEGATVQATVSGSNANAEGADDLTPTGASTGEAHTLRTAGAILELVSTDETFIENNDTLTTDNEGEFQLVFDVTAFEQDVYIDDVATLGTTMGTAGANFQVWSGGTATTAGTAVANLDSDADLESGFFRVNEGETERFTLTVEYDPDIAGFYKVQLYSVNIDDNASAPAVQQLAVPAEDFDSDALSI